jgi:hypothetical protein
MAGQVEKAIELQRPTMRQQLLLLSKTILFVLSALSVSLVSSDAGVYRIDSELLLGNVSIEQIDPDSRGGRAYRLRYVVNVPREIYWRFKTDFDNEFLLENRYIEEHRLVGTHQNTVITENRYTDSPGSVFRWKTTVHEREGRIDFVLLNPQQCGQRFHYGWIRIVPVGDRTLVVQEAFFDFFGAGVWAQYPWAGGMNHFLRYTARWEQETAEKLKERYEK